MYEGKKLSDKCQIYGEKDRKKNFGGGGGTENMRIKLVTL